MEVTSKISNGTYTLINRVKGSHITIKISTAGKQSKLVGRRIVSQLVGPDNTTNYAGFAFLNDNDTIAIWKSKRNPKRHQIAEILRSLMVEGNNSRFAETVEIKLSKRCMRCNRKLTTLQSLADGIGPECIKMMT